MRRVGLVIILIIVCMAVLPAGVAKEAKVKARDLLLPRGYPEIPEAQMALKEVPYAKGAPAVILLKAQEYNWEGYLFKRDRYFRRVKILAEDAIEDYGSFQYNLYGDWNIKDVKARTVLPDGSVLDAEEGINRGESKDGLQAIQIAFPQVQVGAILDLDIHLTSQGLSVDPWTVQESIPILEGRFVMKPPMGLLFRVVPVRLPKEKAQPDFSMPTANSGKAHIWYLRDIEPLPDLAYLPPLEDVSPRLFVVLQQYKDSYNLISLAADWKSWGENRHDEWDEWFDKTHVKVEALARQLVGDLSDPIERAEALRLGLRERLRQTYVSRYVPEDTPDQELDSGSTTTGGFAALTALMLRKLGVDADLLAFRRRSDGVMPTDFPVPRLMNDLMVRIPDSQGGQFYFSPSSSLHVSRMPYECSGVAVFPFDGEADRLVALPDFTASQNITRRIMRAELDAEGNLAVSGSETFKGVSAEIWRSRLRDDTEDERKDRVERSLQSRMEGLLLNSLEISNLDESDKDLIFKVEFEIEGFATVAGKRLIFNPNLYTKMSTSDWVPETREFDVDLRMNWDINDTFMIRLPQGVKTVTGPEPASYPADPVGRHEASYEHRGQMLVAKRHSRIEMFRIPPRFYEGLRRWFSDVATLDETPVVVELE